MPCFALVSLLRTTELALTWLLSLCLSGKVSPRCIIARELLLRRPGSCVPRGGQKVGLQCCCSCIRSC